jgi:hypothetical protein
MEIIFALNYTQQELFPYGIFFAATKNIARIISI